MNNIDAWHTPTMNFGELTPLLDPRSVAIVGASERVGNLGGVAVSLLKQFAFRGEVWPVNPGRDEVHGFRCYPSLAELPGIPDLAILAVPGPASVELVEECGRLGIPSAILWAGGFAEAGGEGIALQERLAEAARAGNVKLCGPNCLGIMNTATGLMATFGSMLSDISDLKTGSISMVSQSGGTSGIASTQAQGQGFGFRVTVSCGNEAVLSLADFVRALVADEGTRVIALYVEGLSDPADFVAALEMARDAGKPVVIMKTGASEASGAAAQAHTGKLAGSDRAFEAVFRETGAIRVWSVEELLDTCLLCATLPEGVAPQGTGISATTFGGGAGVIVADSVGREGIEIRELTAGTRNRLKELLTPLASTRNPVDLTPQSINDPKWRELLPSALKAIAADENVDASLFMVSGMTHRQKELRKMFLDLRLQTRKPVVLSWMAPPPGMRERMAADGIYVFTEHARAVAAMARLAKRWELLARPIRKTRDTPPEINWEGFVGPEDSIVPEPMVLPLIESFGLPVAAGRIANSIEEVAEVVRVVGLPVAAKGIASGLTHRAAAGLLALNVGSADEAAEWDRTFRERAGEQTATYEGTWIQRMAPSGFELIVTATRDRDMGLLIGVGLGGNLTEIMDDIVFARAPIDGASARNLIGHLRFLRRSSKALSAAQIGHAAEFVAMFSQLASAAPWKRFSLEVNPIKVSDAAATAVDGLLVIEER